MEGDYVNGRYRNEGKILGIPHPRMSGKDSLASWTSDLNSRTPQILGFDTNFGHISTLFTLLFRWTLSEKSLHRPIRIYTCRFQD